MAALALTEDVDGKKKKRKKKKKKKNKAKDKDQNQGPALNSSCPTGQVECDDKCRDLKSDTEHCGECWESCYEGQICSAGVCTVPCSEHACYTRNFAGDFYGYSIAVMPDGKIAVLGGDEQVGIFDSSGTLVRTIGEFGTEEGEFDNASDLAFGPGGAIYVADSDNDRVQILGDNGSIDVIPFDYPTVIAVGATGAIYTKYNSKIGRLLATGEVPYAWGPDGTDESGFDYLTDISVDGASDIYALSSSDSKIYRFHDDGSGDIAVKWKVGGRGVDPGEFRDPVAIAAISDRVLIADEDGRIHVLNAVDGAFLYKFVATDEYGDALYPRDLAADTAGNLYVADGSIYVYSLKS